jgi:hypothetical protein
MLSRDDIIRMAREVSNTPLDHHATPDLFGVSQIERFFKLAYEAGAAAERNRMIADGWRQCAQGQRATQFCGMAEQARLEEREACARVCDYQHDRARTPSGAARANACAAAIRARGQQRPEPTYPSDPIWREQKRLEMEAWARNKLARHGIQIPEDDDGPLAF